MSSIYEKFDEIYLLHAQGIYRLCFLLSRRKEAAKGLTFDSFLRLGAAKAEQVQSQAQAVSLLYEAAVRLCDDYYLRKARRKPKRALLDQMDLPFAVTDELYALLGEPFERRALAGLLAAGFSRDEACQMIRRARSLPAPRPNVTDDQVAACKNVCMTQEDSLDVSDQVYARFAERSVGVENAIHGFKSSFDRAAPLLALGVLALFAIALWITR